MTIHWSSFILGAVVAVLVPSVIVLALAYLDKRYGPWSM